MFNKSKGFTLAEVLITLGIIGVVAALSAPALIQHAAGAKTGPALSRAISALANGFQAYLYNNNADTVHTANPAIGSKPVELFTKLGSDHIKMTPSKISAVDIEKTTGGGAAVTSDTVTAFAFSDKSAVFVPNANCILEGEGAVERCVFYVLPVGWATKEHVVMGEDAFELAYNNDGDILVYGLDYAADGDYWTDKCTDTKIKSFTPASDKKSCGGRIVANSFKRDY